jgi:uncharacterized protein (DUF433 family)
MQFTFITTDKEILNGTPIIINTRISVEIIMEWIANGATLTSIYGTYNHLPKGSLEEVILFDDHFQKMKMNKTSY